MVPSILSYRNGCNYTHFTFVFRKSNGCSSANHCHLEPAYGLAPSWGNGWGGLTVDHWVIGNQQLGGRPLITSTNLTLISSPAHFLPTLPKVLHQTSLSQLTGSPSSLILPPHLGIASASQLHTYSSADMDARAHTHTHTHTHAHTESVL